MERDQQVPWDSRWKEIIGFPGYWINQYGQVFSFLTLKVMRPWKSEGIGPYVTLRRNNKAYSRSVRSLKLIAFGEENGNKKHSRVR